MADTKRHQDEWRQFWRVERRSNAYISAVQKPCLRVTDDFAETTRILLERAAERIDQLIDDDERIKQVHAVIQDTTDDFNDGFARLRDQWRRLLARWGDDDLEREFRSITEQLQDKMTPALEAYPQDRDPRKLTGILTEQIAQLEAAVVAADPALEDNPGHRG